MNSLVLDVPRMFADHHVLEVRRILQEMQGVDEIYASSSFQAVEVSFDPKKLSEDDLRKALDDAGYLGELDMPLESGEPTMDSNGDRYFRHTQAFESVADVISFGQDVASSARPLWPCPGMSAVSTMDEG
jgi:copper chaperone CopZ